MIDRHTELMGSPLNIVWGFALSLGLVSCSDSNGNDYILKEPPVERRRIVLRLTDPTISDPIVRKLDATRLTISQAIVSIGPVKPSQDVGITCGGYSMQPPHFEVSTMIFTGGKGFSEQVRVFDKSSPLHDVCMKIGKDHINYLKEYAPDELLYYKASTTTRDNDRK